MFYPWNLTDQSGALALFLAYSRALKDAGYRLDCFAPRAAECAGIFENVFVTPDGASPLTPALEFAGSRWQDHLLPERIGRDEASMAAAAVLASVSNYDVVGVQYTRCHSLKHMLPPDMPAVAFTHDLDSLVARQQEMIFGSPTEYRLEDEAERLKPFDLVTVVGPRDRQLLLSVEPALPIVEAPFTSTVDDSATVRESSPGVLLWISSAAPFHRLSFYWFWKNVWPRIRSQRPECRLVVAGRMSEAARQMGAAADPRVSIRGIVPQAEDLYREADVLIAPYYFGLGIKTKVVEALAKGIPVATTTLGIYNTRIQPGREALVSDDASAYADEVIKLVSCPKLRSELAESGRRYVRKWHDPQTALHPLVEAFERVRHAKKKPATSRGSAQRELYEPLRNLVPWTIQRCHAAGAKSVAIYGAGGHTSLLVPMWKALGGPAIRTIVVTNEPEQHVCMGFPVVSADRFDPSTVDAIVLSSHGYEQDMAAACSERWPQLEVHAIWQPVGGPTLDYEGICYETIPASLWELQAESYAH
jgi:hypothetical protein